MPHAQYEDDLIYYEVQNAGDGPPLTLLTGITGSVSAMKEFPGLDAYQGLHEVILIDSLGHGKSDKPDNPGRYTRKHRAGNIAAVLDQLGHESAHVYGYSMGGWLACAMARHQPHRLRSLIVGGWGVDHDMEAMGGVRSAQEYLALSHDAFVRSGLPNPIPDILADAELTCGISHCYDALWEVDGARADLQALRVPLLLMCGTEDEYYEHLNSLAKDTGIDLMSLPGDHNTAVFSLAGRFDDLCAFWANA